MSKVWNPRRLRGSTGVHWALLVARGLRIGSSSNVQTHAACCALMFHMSKVDSLASMLMVHVSQVQNALPERTWSRWECEVFRFDPGYLASIIFVFALLHVEHAQSDSQVESLWCMIWFPLFGVLVWFDTSTKTIVSVSFVTWSKRDAEQLSLKICTGRAVHLSQKSCKFDPEHVSRHLSLHLSLTLVDQTCSVS